MIPEKYDFLACGSGLAGLTYALHLADHGTVCVLTKAAIRDANTSYAQGGIAAAIGEADSWELHERDTLEAGAGLCDTEAVRFLVSEAPSAIGWLQSVGVEFDRAESGDLSLGLEGGHSRHRILHHKDRTGWEVERAVVEAVRQHPNITVIEHAFITKLVIHQGRCIGCYAEVLDHGTHLFLAKATLLATGGCGALYQHTTNPRVATADGIALAIAAGAQVRDLEFMQFHPTTLYHPQLRGFLITEACRGEGGTLRNHLGRRFMYDYDQRLELAPRDIVARAIDSEMKKLGTWCVYLDLTHFEPGKVERSFPTIYEKLKGVGIEFDKDWAPIVPAQHYSCGGITTNLRGQSTMAGLYAAGEVASTGVHGANRLASNSLLEAIVFGRAAAQASLDEPTCEGLTDFPPSELHTINETDAVLIRRKLQHTMTEKVGIVRTHESLREASETIQQLKTQYESLPSAPFAPYPAETWNLLLTAEKVLHGAQTRQENVGLHYNLDLINGSSQ